MFAYALPSEVGVSQDLKCLKSPGGWLGETKFALVTQIIDEYFGRVYMQFSFKKENEIAILFRGEAEYNGYAEGTVM